MQLENEEVLEALEDLIRMEVKIKNAKARIAKLKNILVELCTPSCCSITLDPSNIIGKTSAKDTNAQEDEETTMLVLNTFINHALYVLKGVLKRMWL